MATSGFYYTPRPIITVGPTRYFDVNEERPGAVNEQRLFGGTQRIQVDCADYDRRRANALRVHALLHFGGMIIDPWPLTSVAWTRARMVRIICLQNLAFGLQFTRHKYLYSCSS